MENVFRTVKKCLAHISLLLDYQDLYFPELTTFPLLQLVIYVSLIVAENKEG